MSYFEIATSASIFQLERRSKAQNIGNAHCYLLVYSTSVISYGKKVCFDFKMAAILKNLKYKTQLHFDFKYEKIVPNYAKNIFFMVMTSLMTSQSGLKFDPLNSCLGEARSGSKWQGQCLVNTCEYRNGLSWLYMPKEDLNK